jgi:membrane protein DedA with SNARE-associated domain
MARWPTIAVATIGAVVGDSLGYEIGKRYGERLLQTRVGRRIGEERIERSRSFLQRHGPAAVFTARFVGMLRALVPAAAGDARMPYRRFLLWNAAGAVVWAPAVVLAGELAGRSYDAVGRWMGRATLAVLIIGVAGSWVWKRTHRSRPHVRRAPEHHETSARGRRGPRR